MVRLETVQFFAVIVIIIQQFTHLVECEDKRIVIVVPRRIKTVHHHHHHVVLMDPKTKTMSYTKPYPGRSSMSSMSSSAEVDYQQQRDHHHRQYQRHRQQQQQEHEQQQSEEAESHPLSYFQKQTTIRTAADPNAAYPVQQLEPPVPMRMPPKRYTSNWPARQKRSKIVARLMYTH